MRTLKLLLLSCCLFSGGCGVVNYVTPEKEPYDTDLFGGYRQIVVNKSNSADVLNVIHREDFELLSQSKSVIVSTGQQKAGYKTWFDMAAFDENETAVKRKYFFAIDEKPKVLFKSPQEGLRFDCDVVLPDEVISESYTDENTRRIAILKNILENFRKDVSEVRQDNKALATSGMLVNQSLTTVVTCLDSSPALATRLSEPVGVEFSHISLDKGKVQMVVVADIVRVKIRTGSFMGKRLAGDEIYKCLMCGYIYDPFVGDPKYGIKPLTSTEPLPDTWVCSICTRIIKKQ